MSDQDYDWMQLIQRPEQIDLDGQPQPIPADPPPPPEPARPPAQLGLDIPITTAIRLPHGQGIAYQHPLGE